MFEKLESMESQTLRSSYCYELEEKSYNDPEFKEKFSYWKNSGTEPLKDLTVGNLMKEAAIIYKDRIAVSSVHQNSRLTYRQLHDQIELFAAGLVALDLQKGDHVGIWAPNNVEWFVSIMAIIKAGFIAVNLNPLYECPELHFAVEKTDVKVIIIGDTLNERSYYQMLRSIVPELSSHDKNMPIRSETLPHLRIVISMSNTEYKGVFRWRDVLSMATDYHKEKLQRIEEQIDVYDVCNIQFTSGSTGSIKGACLTHHNIVNNSYFTGKRMQLYEKPHVLCLQVPLFHTFGTVLGLLVSVHYGVTVVFPSLKFSPTKSVEAIAKEKCTILYGTPTMFIDIITVATKMMETDEKIFEKMASLELALTAGAICTSELFKKMKNILGFKHIFSGYGMTEVSPIAFFSKPTDNEELITTTVGHVADHSEIKVINESGHIVPFGVPGECCFRGYNLMKGYYKDQEITDKAILPGGWLRSGDRLILLENGYGKVVGRIKDTIIRGGENIEPSEIENILAYHPDIVNVQVYGVSDKRLGEAVAAAIIKRNDSRLCEDDVRNYCDGKVAYCKIPKYVEFVEDYPRTASGKISSAGLVKFKHVTLFTNTKKYSQKLDVGLQDNVIVEESKIFHSSISKLKSRNKPNGPLLSKCDNFGRSRRPFSFYPYGQRPPRSSQPNRYSSSDDAIRRVNSKTNPSKGVFVAGKVHLWKTPKWRVRHRRNSRNHYLHRSFRKLKEKT